MNTVSIVIPTYNRAEFLNKALGSVQNQTYKEIECVVVDGGSTDDTFNVLSKHDGLQIELIRREEPQGIANARNAGIEIASGRYIMFLDDDDRLLPKAIERLVDELSDRPEGCAGVTAAGKVFKSGQIVNRLDSPLGVITGDDLADWNIVGGPTGVLFRIAAIEAIGGFNESFPSREDYDLYLRLTEDYFLVGIDEVLYEREIHPEQMSEDTDIMLEGNQMLIEKHASRLSNSHKAKRFCDMGQALAARGNMQSALRCFSIAVWKDPWKIHHYYYLFAALLGRQGYNILT